MRVFYFYLRFDALVSSILEKLVPPPAARRVPAKKEEYAIMYSVSLNFIRLLRVVFTF